jgi:hypothetical protein
MAITPPPARPNKELTIYEIPIEGITINKPVIKLTEAGQTEVIHAIPLPNETTATDFTWTIDNPDIATLTPNGAECIVTAKTADRQKDSCLIRVISENAISLTVAVSTVPPPPPIWKSKAPVPEVCYDHSVAAWNGKIYVIGGYNGSGATLNTNYCYDVATDTWSTKAILPEGLNDPSAAAWDGKIYVHGNDTLTTYCYDITTNSWSTKTPIPEDMFKPSATAWNGKIYYIGTCIYPNYCYDITTNSWSTKTYTLDYEIADHAAAAVDAKIYIIGGINRGPQQTNYCYDIATDSWSQKTDIPERKMDSYAAAVDGKIYVMGGSYTSTTNTNYCYDVTTDTWTTKEPLPEVRRFHSAAEVDGKIYVMGGSTTATSSGAVNTNYCYTPSLDV